MAKIFSSNKNIGSAPGKIFSSNKIPGRHNISSLLDTAGVGKKSSNSKAGRYAAKAGHYAGKAMSKIGSKVVDAGIDKAAQALAAETAGISLVAGELIKKHKKETIILILLIIIWQLLPFLFILWLLIGEEYYQLSQMQPQTNPLQITKTGPTTAKVGDTLHYTLNVVFPGSATGMIVSDALPPGVSYVSSNPKGTFANNTITWDSSKVKINLNDPINDNFSFTLKATQNNDHVINYATVTLTGASQTGGSGGNVPGNHSTCGGKYTLSSPFANYGDPQCNFTKQGFAKEVKAEDGSHYAIWDCMTSLESGYNPNAYNPNSASGKGAYGLLQMNPQGKGNGSFDAGNVNWPVQISNAINYNNKDIHGSFAYWSTYSSCH